MIPLFLGLTIANLALLGAVFVMGLFVVDHTGEITGMYNWHLPLGIAAGLMVALTHTSVYMYHMATSRWLEAASDKVGIEPARWVEPALKRKRKVFLLFIASIVMVMLAMFAGALADPTVNPLWSGEVHMIVGLAALAVNVAAALSEFRHIRAQGRLMDDALGVLNQPVVEGAASSGK